MDNQKLPSTALPNQSVPPSIPDNPKPKFNLFLLLSAIIITLLIGIGSYYLGKTSNKQTSLVNPSITPSLPSPTLDQTAYWKTYASILFSTQYPADWSIVSNFPNSSNDSIEIQGRQSENLSLTVHKGIGPGIGTATCKIGDNKNVKEEEILVDKTVATKQYFQCSRTNQRSIVVSASQKIPMLTLEYWYQSTSSTASEKILDQILSTFKFLDQTTDDPRSDELKVLDKCVPTTGIDPSRCYNQKTKETCESLTPNCRWSIALP